MNDPMNTQLFDKAAQFAIEAHRNTERRGKGFPYIIHPMEAAAIVATVSNDPELLAAAILHDTVEDTDTTIEEIREQFGERVATLVQHETSPQKEGLTWRDRKQMQIAQLENSPRESKIVAIGDKLSNMRAIANDYRQVGDALWSRFHAPDGKKDIEWYYRGLAGALFELSETLAYQEFVSLMDKTFGPMAYEEAEPIALDDYEESGDGFYATSYNHHNGQTMVKLYEAEVGKGMPQRELRMAHSVFRMGLPVPMPGRLVTDGRRYGAEFRRISPKESFARYVSNRPESCEEIGRRFAHICRQLHQTPCDTILFDSEKRHIRQVVAQCPRISSSIKELLYNLIDRTPDVQTCLHGDMHIGNVITTALTDEKRNTGIQQDFWIDLGDFRWGHPNFDLGMFYLASKCNDEAMTQHLYHISNAMMQRVWDAFVRDYYDSDDSETLAAHERELRPYAALKIIHFDTVREMTPQMQEQIVELVSGLNA